MIKRAWQAMPWWVWVCLILLLPITSMPLIVNWIGSDSVAAPSGIALAVLVIIWLVPYVLKRGRFPSQAVPLLGFVLVALISTSLAAFLPIMPYKDISFIKNELKDVLTLLIGICFYLVAAIFPVGEARLQKTLRWLNWGGLIILLWSLVQALSWFSFNHYPDLVRHIQEFFSSGPLYRQRVNAFAFEPSWLAHQLNMVYLPIWLAATVRRFSVHKFRLLGITFENMLFVGGISVLFLTYSRVGLLAFLLTVTYLFIQGNIRLSQWIKQRMTRRKLDAAIYRQRTILSFSITAIFIVSYLAILAGGAFALSRLDPRMKDLFTFSFGKDDPVLRYADRLNIASRLVYWQAGWGVFNDYPILGVGLGNAGYFFTQKLTPYAWSLVEVRDLVYRSANLLNIKSLWVRLLAETGIVGFAFFVSWLYLLWQSTRAGKNNSSPTWKSLSLAGKFVLLGLLFEGFSLDSFALPYIWFALGLLTAASSSIDPVDIEK
ncbi:MAG: O-antigen ligase family protein [Anaerolineaceae bacterium]|nr:O-antigen ligase family protein [Anaerolineaceae bacterium]